MSTNGRYSPVSSQDADLDSRDDQSFSTRVGPLPEDELGKLQQGLEDNRKPHKENDYHAFTNAVAGDIIQIPNWPGPQTLEKTRTERALLNLGYILCLVPPLFFLGKDTTCTMNDLNSLDIP
jgi:hypothetical protein